MSQKVKDDKKVQTKQKTKEELDTQPSSPEGSEDKNNQASDSEKKARKINKKDYFFIFLCSALLWGNQFASNMPSPLQTQIETHMGINSTQFNLYYSVRSVASMLSPLAVNFALSRYTMRQLMCFICITSVVAQVAFVLGLFYQIHILCIAGRFMIGISDSLTIFQQTVMCLYFTASQLPIVFGMTLLMGKLVRTTNDNGAAMFYEWLSRATDKSEVDGQALCIYVGLGAVACIGSTFVALLLGKMHADHSGDEKDKKDGKKEDGSNKLTMANILNRTIILFIINNAFGYGSVHALYPNISKFFQDRFQYTPLYAGFISSLPYMCQSFSSPFLGGVTSYFGKAYFEPLLLFSVALLFSIHVYYCLLSDVTAEGEVGGLATIIPMVPFGLAHSLFTTVQMSTVRKVVKNPQHLSRVLTYVKMCECLSQCALIFMAGYIRTVTGSYFYVSLMLAICAGIAVFADILLIHDQKAIGSEMLGFLNFFQSSPQTATAEKKKHSD